MLSPVDPYCTTRRAMYVAHSMRSVPLTHTSCTCCMVAVAARYLGDLCLTGGHDTFARLRRRVVCGVGIQVPALSRPVDNDHESCGGKCAVCPVSLGERRAVCHALAAASHVPPSDDSLRQGDHIFVKNKREEEAVKPSLTDRFIESRRFVNVLGVTCRVEFPFHVLHDWAAPVSVLPVAEVHRLLAPRRHFACTTSTPTCSFHAAP